jgi:hypothetical protein
MAPAPRLPATANGHSRRASSDAAGEAEAKPRTAAQPQPQPPAGAQPPAAHVTPSRGGRSGAKQAAPAGADYIKASIPSDGDSPTTTIAAVTLQQEQHA